MLMWERAPASAPDGGVQGAYVQSDALAYCAGLALGGYGDWRLPSAIELLSIVDYGVAPPATDHTYFPGTPASFFWSATPVAGSTTNAWVVDFAHGYVNVRPLATPFPVRCVR